MRPEYTEGQTETEGLSTKRIREKKHLDKNIRTTKIIKARQANQGRRVDEKRQIKVD